jgi:DNA-directed RNA polymerase specialized sigma24 family protein
MKCEQCETAFVPTKPWARFCSESCRIRAHRAKNRVSTIAGLAEAERALTAALDAVRAGDAPTARVETGAALAALDAVRDPLLDVLERAIGEGHSAASIARACGLSSGALGRWRTSGKAGLETRAAVATWLAAHGYRAG